MNIAYVLNWIGIGCWIICFWWMHRISKRQEAVLEELKEQARRIEHFSRQEHDLIQEVHPAVNEIKDGVADVAAAVKNGS